MEEKHHTLKIKKSTRWLIALITVSSSLYLLKPFITSQVINRGSGYLNFGRYRDAVREYKKAIFLNPNIMFTWNWLGYAYSQMGKSEKAIETYKKAVQINPLDIIAYHELGMGRLLKKDFKGAKPFFQKASTIGPEHKKIIGDNYTFYYISSLRCLAICCEKLGEIRCSIKNSKKILKYYPEDKIEKNRIERLIKLRKEKLD